jgi:hypothetical protein
MIFHRWKGLILAPCTNSFVPEQSNLFSGMEWTERIYHQNEFGWTLKCPCHNAVHLNFGNVSLLLSHQQLSDFSEYIYDAVIRCKQDTDDPNMRDIHIPTRDLCILFTLSYNELNKLLELTEQTLLMLQIDDALDINTGCD